MASVFKRGGKRAKGNYYAAWFDHNGKRQTKCTRTTDKATAERIAKKYEADAALRRDGVIDPTLDAISKESQRTVESHLEDYEAKLQAASRTDRYIQDTLRYIRAIAEEQKFGVVVFHYTTDETGALLDETGCKGKLKLWLFSEAKFAELRALNEEWPLMDKGPDETQVDLRISCDEEKWQRMKYVPTKNAHWKSKPDWYAAIQAKTEKAKKRMASTIGAERTISEIREILGIAPSVPQNSNMGSEEVDLSDIMGD